MPFGIEIDMERVGRDLATMMGDFTTGYFKAFARALVKKMLDDAFERKGDDAAEPRQLKQLPEPHAPDKKGELKGTFLGKSKKRYFFVKDNYDIGYSGGPDQKEQGSINLWGYKVQSVVRKPEGARKGGPDWIPDEERPNCKACNKQFSLVVWHHHCRNCGEVFCSDCSSNKASMTHFGYEKPQRVCDECFAKVGRSRAGSIMVEQPKEEKTDFFGIQLVHSTRTPYMFECANAQEKQEWMEVFTECCRKAALPINPDPVQAAAFEEAHQAAMWSLGYWYWWRITGTEAEMLSDLFGRAIERTVVDPALDQSPLPANVKRMASSAIKSQVVNLVRQVVDPGWKAICGQISKVQEEVSGKARPLLEPIGKARNDAVDRLRNGVAEATAPAMEKLGNAILDKVLAKASTPIVEAFTDMFAILHQSLMAGADNINDRAALESFCKSESREFRSWWGRLYPVHRKVWDYCWNVRNDQAGDDLLKHFPVSKTFDKVMDRCHILVEQSLLTLQEEVKDPSPANFKAGWASVRAKLVHDTQLDVMILLEEMLQNSADGAVRQNVIENPALKGVLEPVDELIPEAVRDYLSVQNMADELITGIVHDAVSKLVSSSASGTKAKVADGAAGLQ